MSDSYIDVLLAGRLVCGHPMIRRPVKKKDPATGIKVPVIRDGQPVTETYVAVALPKDGSIDWKQTAWGQQLYAKAVQDWPNGEHGMPAFAYKVTDGDSPVPNTKGKKPCDREGWPGHWVVHCSTQWAVSCYHVGKYDLLDQIENDKEIKTGDFCRIQVSVKGNGPSESPGIYVSPKKFELAQIGTAIISESGPTAAEVFGGAAPATGGGGGAASAPAPGPGGGGIAPAPDFLDGPAPPKTYNVSGTEYTAEQLKASGWSDAQIAALP